MSHRIQTCFLQVTTWVTSVVISPSQNLRWVNRSWLLHHINLQISVKTYILARLDPVSRGEKQDRDTAARTGACLDLAI